MPQPLSSVVEDIQRMERLLDKFVVPLSSAQLSLILNAQSSQNTEEETSAEQLKALELAYKRAEEAHLKSFSKFSPTIYVFESIFVNIFQMLQRGSDQEMGQVEELNVVYASYLQWIRTMKKKRKSARPRSRTIERMLRISMLPCVQARDPQPLQYALACLDDLCIRELLSPYVVVTEPFELSKTRNCLNLKAFICALFLCSGFISSVP